MAASGPLGPKAPRRQGRSSGLPRPAPVGAHRLGGKTPPGPRQIGHSRLPLRLGRRVSRSCPGRDGVPSRHHRCAAAAKTAPCSPPAPGAIIGSSGTAEQAQMRRNDAGRSRGRVMHPCGQAASTTDASSSRKRSRLLTKSTTCTATKTFDEPKPRGSMLSLIHISEPTRPY